MEYGSIYHRTSDNYCYPHNDTDLIINIRTGYDIRRVFIHYGDPFSAGILGGNEKWEGQKEEIFFKKRLQHHLWWTTTLQPSHKRCRYYFSLHTETEEIFYFEDGFYTADEMQIEGKALACFTYPWMNRSDLNTVPAWVNDTVWYQIFPERFCNGSPENDPPGTKPWNYEPAGIWDYYGGDLKGICDKLAHIESLGVSGLYLTPVFKAGSNHKYDTADYRTIDPAFGTNAEMAELVKAAHDRGIKVMLDGVFNHCGEQFAPWREVLKNGPDSPYFDWFMINQWPFDPTLENTRGGEYYSFAYAAGMPKLNTNNPEVIQYFLDIVTGWIREFDIDGLRLDVANEISHTFCKELRSAAKALKPDFYILGEIWHDSISWLKGDEFDAVMNYPLGSSINDFWLYKDWPKEKFEYAINRNYTMYMQQTNDVLFNLLDSHDTNRLLDKTGGDLDVFYQQLAVLFTMPGSPCIYYGTEIAMAGGHDPDCRRCMPWNEIESGVFDERLRDIRELIRLRREHPACKSRHFHFPNEIADPRVLEYMKLTDDQVMHVLINCGENAVALPPHGPVLYQRGGNQDTLFPKGILIYAQQ